MMRLQSVVLLTTILCISAWGQTYNISTFAGGALPLLNIPGTSASLTGAVGIAADPAGNVFFVNQLTVLRWDATTGVLTLVAGNGTPGFSGDNGPATSAQLNDPMGVAVDSSGNLYIADGYNYRVRKVSGGVITTVAGGGSSFAENSPATSVQLYHPDGVTADSAGNLYIIDHFRILKITNGVIATVAGTGVQGYSGDNGPATSAQIAPAGLAVDSSGSLYIANTGGYNRIRKVTNGVITTVAGNGTQGFSGDNGPATNAQFYNPDGVAVDSAGNLYVADMVNNRVRKVSNGVITTVAGNGTYGFSGDNGPAASARLTPISVAVDSAGDLYISDNSTRIRKVTSGVIATVAGGGSSRSDNFPATCAQLAAGAIAVDSAGDLYIADFGSARIREVSTGVITTVAGAGWSHADNVPATSTLLSPEGIAADSAGNIYISDWGDGRIRKLTNGVITTVAGGGSSFADKIPATSAQFYGPGAIAVDSAGDLYISDMGNHRVRKVSGGVITTVAGGGSSLADNIPATSALLSGPTGLAVDSAGSLYIADNLDHRIRKVSNGVITTVAGNGTQGFSGDNGPATNAQLDYPYGVAVDSAGNLYITDSYNSRVRKVSSGVITTVAGNGTAGYSGNNGPATSAQLYNPSGVAVDSGGNLYVADYDRILILTPAGSSCTHSVSPATLQAPASGGNLTVTIQAASACPWTVSGLPGWIAVATASSGSGAATVTLLASPNSGTPLSATILVAGVSVTVTQPAAALARLAPIKGVTNAASYATGAVSPGEVVTIFGTGIGPATAAYATMDPATGKLATTIGGVQVLFNGTPAPMIYAGSTQVSVVVPYETAPISNPSVWIDYAGHTSNAYQLSSVASVPGLFSQNASGSGLGAILNQDNSLNGPSYPAAKGSILQIYMTGEGQTTPQPVTGAITTVTLPPPQVTPAPVQPISVSIGGQSANYIYAGEAPGIVAGVMQLNVQVPANAPSGAQPILVSIGGNMSQSTVTVSVQ
jgi:uncharacterized protein (TIGR03437 family)